MSPPLPSHIDLHKLREIFLALAKRRIRNEHDAEEIAQEALITVVEKFPALDIQKSFLQWAFGILRNKIGNYYQGRDRRARREQGEGEESLRHRPADDWDPLALVAERELGDKLTRCWARLKPQCRELLGLLYRGASREEIFARYPQYHYKVVNTKIFRCRNYLKRLLRQEGYAL